MPQKGMATTIPENIYNINEKGFLELGLKLFALTGISMRHALCHEPSHRNLERHHSPRGE